MIPGTPPTREARTGTDALIAYLIHSTDPQLESLVEIITSSRSNPLGSASALDHLWAGHHAVQESQVLSAVYQAVSRMAWLVELYAPLLALGSLILALRIVWPVAAETMRYPVDVVEGRSQVRLGGFARDQWVTVWREIRVTVWMFIFLRKVILVL